MKKFPRKVSKFSVDVVARNVKLRETLRCSFKEVKTAISVVRRLHNHLRKEEPWATESIRALRDALVELEGLVPEEDLKELSEARR